MWRDMLIEDKDFEHMRTLGVGIEEYFILISKVEGNDWLTQYKPSNESYKKLRDKHLLYVNNDVSLPVVNTLQQTMPSNRFEEWWNLYPSTDAIPNYFSKTRALRGPKAQAKKAYIRAILDGWTDDQLINALKMDINNRKSRLTYTNNPFKFMKHACRWLQQQEYVSYIVDNTQQIINTKML